MIYVYAPDHRTASIYIDAEGISASPLDTKVVVNGAMNIHSVHHHLAPEDTVHILPGADAPDEAKNAAEKPVKPAKGRRQ